jgi:hypothetical protein
MSWFNTVVGSDVPLSHKVRERIGVNGFGVDDVGAIEHPGAVAALLEMGGHLGVLTEDDIENFVALEQGSKLQVGSANRLGRMALTGLHDRIESEVGKRLTGVPGMASDRYREYQEWADRSGWSFPVGCLDTDVGRCLCMQDDPGLCVFECPVAQVEGKIGDAATALADYLCNEALKIPAHVAIDYSLMMGLDASSLVRHEGFEKLREAPGEEVLKWLEKADPDMHMEISYWENDLDVMANVAGAARDLAFAHHDEQKKIERVLGKGGHSKSDPLVGIRRAAGRCEDSELKRFIVKACSELKGERRHELMDRLPMDERFERLPGDLCVLDTGVPIENLEERYHYLNEAAMNGDDMALLPLESDPETVVDVLLRITLCERLLLALAVVIEHEERLSEAA